jgi:predicted metalloprotease with PDZ domain
MRTVPPLTVRMPVVAMLPLCAALAACSTSEPVELPQRVDVSPEIADLAPPSAAAGISIGLDAEQNESDSLEHLERLPGTRVRAVEPSGTAAAAGVKAGDVILTVDGIRVDDPDALSAAIQRSAEGSTLRLQVRRGTTVFETGVLARARPGAAIPPRELYRADPVRARAGFRTQVVDDIASPRTAAAIVEIFPGSPLAAAGLRKGDLVLALDGRPVASAHDLVRTLVEAHEPGDKVRLDVLRGGEVLVRKVRLHEPDRRLTKLAAIPLFRYRRTAARTEFSLIDLWVVSLFSFRKEEGEKEYRFFSLIRFATGRGELREVPKSGGEGR